MPTVGVWADTNELRAAAAKGKAETVKGEVETVKGEIETNKVEAGTGKGETEINKIEAVTGKGDVKTGRAGKEVGMEKVEAKKSKVEAGTGDGEAGLRNQFKVPSQFERGVVFYLRQNRVVGVLMWNLFDKIAIARQVRILLFAHMLFVYVHL